MQIALSQVLQQGIEQKLEQRLELKLELQQKVMLSLPKEFSSYINIEKDEDVPLLKRSLPFLVLHELSHPLYSAGKLFIPIPVFGESYHNGIETGIDRASMLLGPLLQRYTAEEMLQSHYAMMERIFRDEFQLKKHFSEATFLARAYAEIKMHREQTISPELRSKLERLLKVADENIPSPSFGAIVQEYSQIYRQTMFVQ